VSVAFSGISFNVIRIVIQKVCFELMLRDIPRPDRLVVQYCVAFFDGEQSLGFTVVLLLCSILWLYIAEQSYRRPLPFTAAKVIIVVNFVAFSA